MRTHQFSLALLSTLALAACPKGVPGRPGGGDSGVDPNSCGNYAASEAGHKLKAFLEATAQLSADTNRVVDVVRESCTIMGKELGMSPADLGGQTKDVCAKVYGQIDANLKVAFKGKAALKIDYKPAVCRVNVEATAKAAAECEGKASADVGASCSGTCNGRCEGTCAGSAGTSGSGGECHGQCKGTCHGSCEGHANVEASAQCKASAQVKANADIQCTEPELKIEADAKLVVDDGKAKATIAAMRAGLPKILSVKARLEPMKFAVKAWADSAAELKNAGGKLANSFKEQALCVSGQIAAAASLIGNIQANVSVSVEVSASASGTIGG